MVAEGVRKPNGRNIKSVSPVLQRQALRNEPRSQDRRKMRESVCLCVCWESRPSCRSNETNTQIRREKNIKQNKGEGVRQVGVNVVYREDDIYILAGLRLGIHTSSLMHLCTSMTATSQTVLSSHCFRPCWKHKESFVLMYPTSPSIWASQGNSFMLVRCSLCCIYLLLLFQAEIRACINLDSLRLLITLMIPSSPSRNL